MSQEIRRMVPPSYFAIHYSQITFKTSFQNCVLKALQNRHWRQIDNTGWHLQWSEKERINDVFEEGLTAGQRCNHFRLWGQLCRKDMMIKNLRKHKRQLQKDKTYVQEEWNFVPLTFFLPSQYIMLAEEFKKRGGLWIMKPTSRCQGQGIFIVDKLSQVAPFRNKPSTNQSASTPPPSKISLRNIKKEDDKEKGDKSSEQEIDEKEEVAESYLIQQYISRPLLFGSKKFDLRIYCLCTNYSHLTAWLYRSGFARFTHEPYNTEDINKLQGHLTNVQIQKHSQKYDEVRGGKWLLNNFKHYLFSRYDPKRVDWCFTQIKNIIVRSLQAVQKNILPSRNSFELYGYDFMIDQSLKPWLIQVNGGPSMSANTPFDCQLKCGLIDDVLTIIDHQGILTGRQMTVGGFDLIIDKGVKVVQPKASCYSGLLGTKNQRIAVVRGIVRKFLFRKRKEKQAEDAVIQQQQKIPKKRGRAEGQGRQKLLPDFYYRRKLDGIDWDSRNHLKQLLSEYQSFNNDYSQKGGNLFRPIKVE